MIPLRDTIKSRTIPFVNYTFILTCGAVFFFELSLGNRVDALFYRFGVIPVELTSLLQSGHLAVKPMLALFTSMFLHGGWLHLIGNMLFLYVFGDNVEDKLGHIGFFFFYLIAGAGAAAVEVYFHPNSPTPLIGASGAIAGVMGAYFILYPKARVLTMIPLFVFFPVVELSAFFFLGFWFVMQFLQGSLAVGADQAGG
ncbi:MAG: rhomboid family intramembrane serine protease, partial [Bacteroidota bacterium]